MWIWLLCAAFAFPEDDSWVGLTVGGGSMTDPVGDRTLGTEAIELVSGSSGSVVAWWADTSTVYIRLGISGDPTDGEGLTAATWGLLIDTDGDLETAEAVVVAELSAGLLDVYLGDGTAGTQPGFGAWSFADNWGEFASGEVRAVPDGATWALDFAWPRDLLATVLGIGPDTSFRLAAATGPSVFVAWADVGFCDGLIDACNDLAPVLADPLTIDQDLDGLTGPEEVRVGLLAMDSDSDDDGVLDGAEALADNDGDGLIDGLDCDSDDDDVLDSVEWGVDGVGFAPDTDVAAGCAILDADPATTTNPTQADSDGGGLADGLEDRNFDGQIDGPWETDPNDPSDDVDSDADGIADVLELLAPDGVVDDVDSDGDGLTDFVEGLIDHDLDGLPDFADVDSDGDCVLDADELLADPDLDGVPAYLDADSDGDGLLDSLEAGAECLGPPIDSDGDDTPDFLDDDSDGDGVSDAAEGGGDLDGDGLIDSIDPDTDGDGLANQDEGSADPDGDGVPSDEDLDSDDDGIPDAVEGLDDVDGDDIPNAEDTDSDGDGAPDGEEGTDDVDCDGVMNFVDPDDDDNFCDSGQAYPTVDTDPWTDDNGADAILVGEYTGGSCHHTGPTVLWTPLLLLLLSLRRRQWALAAVLCLPTLGWAQEVNAQRFAPTTDGGTFVRLEDLAVVDGATVGGIVSTAKDPLVFRAADEEIDLLSQVTTLDLLASVGVLDRVALGVALPLHWSSGDLDGGPARVGDLRLDGKVGIADVGVFRFGSRAVLGVPTGPAGGWTSSTQPRADVLAVADVAKGPFRAASEFGFRTGTGAELGELTVSQALLWGAGVGAVAGPWTAALEAEGEWWTGNAVDSGDFPAEWTVSGQRRFGRVSGIIGAGTGLSRGLGAPDWRALVGVMFGPKVVPVSPTAEPKPVLSLPPEDAFGDVVVRAVSTAGDPVPGAEVRILGTLGAPLRTGADGILEAKIAPGSYEVTVAAAGWRAVSSRFDLEAGGRRDLSIELAPEARVVVDLDAGRIFLARKVFFEVDLAELKVESLETLDSLVEVLGTHPDIDRVRVEGHTDSTGTAAYNQKLSEARAVAVVAYLVRSGVDATRLEGFGFGEGRPLQLGDSEDVHATNRRVEFHIVHVK